jgi:hypothetical protein
MNRRSLILAGLALLPTTALPGRARAQRRQTGRRAVGGLATRQVRTRIVNRTFTSTVPIATPSVGAATPYPALLQVRGLPQGRILKVRLALIGLSHAAPEEVDIMLVAPGGRAAVVLSDVGGGTDIAGITLVLDQEAPGRLPDQFVSGTFQPLNKPPALDAFPAPALAGATGHSLTVFNNTNPNGLWRLFVADGEGFDNGTLAGWSLLIRARIKVVRRRRQRTSKRSGQGTVAE